MRESFAERHHFLVFALLLAAGLVLTTVGVRSPDALSPLQDAGLAVTGPFSRAAAAGSRALGDAWRGLFELRSAHEELALARTEARDLRLLLSDRDELAHENDRLRTLLGLAQRTRGTRIPARVIQRDLSSDHLLVIDRGTRDGVREDMAVLAADGVVGKVLSATPHVAKVQCLTDPDAGIAVLVGEDRRQANAVVADARAGLCRLRHLELLKSVEPGDRVLTSGLDQVHGRGWLVGTVESVEDVMGIEREVLVRPVVDFQRLEEVLVVAREPAVQARTAEVRP